MRVDTFGYAGYTTNPRFDSLLAKLIVHSPSGDYSARRRRKAYRALCEFRIEGSRPIFGFLQNLLRHPEFAANRIYTRFIEEHVAELAGAQPIGASRLFFERASASLCASAEPGPEQGLDTSDPLAVLHHGKSEGGASAAERSTDVAMVVAPAPLAHEIEGPEGTVAVTAPMQGTIVSIDVHEGDSGAPRAAASRDGSDEDGARHPRAGQRDRAADRGRKGRRGL